MLKIKMTGFDSMTIMEITTESKVDFW